MKNIIKENQAEDGLLYLLFLAVADDGWKVLDAD